MRHLLQPRVLQQATLAALISVTASYPRIALWENRPMPLWYPLATLFVCGIVLWSFVFAWHEPYTQRPAFVWRWKAKPFAWITLAGVFIAAAHRLWLDPSLKSLLPDVYPADVKHWAASALFALGFLQLFLVFASFDMFLRLFRNGWVASGLTTLLGVAVLAMKISPHADQFSGPLLAGLFLSRLATVFIAAMCYWRGGIVPAWWWALLLDARQLPDLI